MKVFIRPIATRLFALFVFIPAIAIVRADPIIEEPATAQETTAFSQAELDQMLAPVALYPDSLLSQIFMASTYPLEVAQAARWSRANPNLKGEAAVNAVANQS